MYCVSHLFSRCIRYIFILYLICLTSIVLRNINIDRTQLNIYINVSSLYETAFVNERHLILYTKAIHTTISDKNAITFIVNTKRLYHISLFDRLLYSYCILS